MIVSVLLSRHMPVTRPPVGSPSERNPLAGDNKPGAAAVSRDMESIIAGHAATFPTALYWRLVATELMMADDFPLSILDRRISAMREKIHEMRGNLALLTGDERTKLSEHIAAEAKELDGLVAERNILAADAR
jgi:hypothetical protein